MAVFIATSALIYAASLCFVIALFARTLLLERRISVDTAGTVRELASAQAIDMSSPAESHAAAKTA
ncbi:hypothetical protein [Flexivirga alba]|uniref:Uncharacterized protein n=1 Tax=Flexivirga alba TaxID=702742 RepID=A0ABW2AFT6_9MICO